MAIIYMYNKLYMINSSQSTQKQGSVKATLPAPARSVATAARLRHLFL
jgi:hypothetical protein